MTILGKIVAHLTKYKANYSITYVMLSRVHKFSNIGLKDSIDIYRLCEVIRKQSKIKRHINEKHDCLN